MYRILCLVVFGTICASTMACTPPQPPLPPRVPYTPPMAREVYRYEWTPPPTQEAGSAGLTLCVVRPDLARESSLALPTYKAFVDGFSASLAADLDKLLVAKGVAVTGPYATYDDITYGDKKTAELALTPLVFVSISDPLYGAPAQVGSNGVTDYIERKFSMTVQGFVQFVLIEPLSRQKLWVKKLELETRQVSGVQAFEARPVIDPATGRVARIDIGKPLYSGLQEAVGDVMMEWYPMIAEKAWTYLNVEEMHSLKQLVLEIRQNSGSIIK